jgi:hypothetical protein
MDKYVEIYLQICKVIITTKRSNRFGIGTVLVSININADAGGSGGGKIFERKNPAGSGTVQNPKIMNKSKQKNHTRFKPTHACKRPHTQPTVAKKISMYRCGLCELQYRYHTNTDNLKKTCQIIAYKLR